MNINPRVGYVLSLIFVAAFATSGCSTNVKLTPQQSDGQKVVYQDGRQVLISEKDNVVTLAPSASVFIHSKQAKFVVAVKNQGDSDFVFSTNNISAGFEVIQIPEPQGNQQTALASFNFSELFGISTAEASTPEPTEPLTPLEPIVTHERLTVFSYQDLMQAERDRQSAAAFAAALGGIGRSMQASQAGYSYNSGTYGGYGSGYGSSYGSYSGYSYDPAKAQAAQNAARSETDADFARIKAEGAQNTAELNRTILKMQTVTPGQWYGGSIIVQMPKPQDKAVPVNVVVNLGGERHEFKYLYEKVAK